MASKRVIGILNIHACLAEESFKLCLAQGEFVETGIQNDDDIVSRNQMALSQTPTFSCEPSGAVAGNRIRICANRNENGPIQGAGIRHDMQPHPLAREPGAAAEDLFDLGRLSDSLFL
jgi:hypothetical protein